MISEINFDSHEQMQLAYNVLRELRPALSFADFLQLSRAAKTHDDYKIFCMINEGRCEAYLGFRFLYDFVHGKHLYVDDLIVTEKLRSKKMGAELLQFAEQAAKNNGCTKLRLCTGVDNDRGKTFYENNDWELRAVVYKKTLR